MRENPWSLINSAAGFSIHWQVIAVSLKVSVEDRGESFCARLKPQNESCGDGRPQLGMVNLEQIILLQSIDNSAEPQSMG
jgi:hypothetical protein